MRQFSFIILLCGVLTIAINGPSMGQNVRTVPGASEIVDPAATGPVLVAPYDKKLMRLAEVLGAIHYLRELCNADEGQLWRAKMSALIEAEQPQPPRRTRMIARFNRGYGAFNRTYRTCTKSALLAINGYMKEGVLLTSQINARYGR